MNDLKAKNKRPNDDVRRNCEMDLQKGAVGEETSEKREERLKMNDELIISAFCLRNISLSLPIDRRRRLER